MGKRESRMDEHTLSAFCSMHADESELGKRGMWNAEVIVQARRSVLEMVVRVLTTKREKGEREAQSSHAHVITRQ